LAVIPADTLLPANDAVIVADAGAVTCPAVIENDPELLPAGIVIDDGTLTAEGLLLDNWTTVFCTAAAFSDTTFPPSDPPAVTEEPASVMEVRKICTPGTSETIADAVLVESAWLVAVMVTDWAADMLAGAEYNPLAEMDPTPAGRDDQLTPVLVAPETDATNC